MNDPFGQYADILAAIQAAAGEEPVYLVGGAVRDALLGEPARDLDFALAKNARKLARRIADRLHGAYYPLDEIRDIGRVIVNHTSGNLVLDFSLFRGGGLESDLRGRDFTINAIALDVANTRQLIDPLHGAQDLRDRVLRLCAPTALLDDPVRVLRAIRVALCYRLRFPAETTAALHSAAPRLAGVSAERARDELFRMFDGPNAVAAVNLLDHFGALPILLPELDGLKGVEQTAPHIYPVWEHTLAVAEALETLVAILTRAGQGDKAANLRLSTVVLFLGRFKSHFLAHFETPLTAGRSLRALLFLAALYHDAGKPPAATQEQNGRIRFLGHEDTSAQMIEQRGQALALSGVELARLKTVAAEHMRIHSLAATGRPPTRRAIYRFFRATGPAGVDLTILTLADLLGTYGVTLPQETLETELAICQALLEAYWEQGDTVISPPRLLSGDDLQREFGLRPGPQVGALLEALQEAQASGEIADRAAAIRFIAQRIEKP